MKKLIFPLLLILIVIFLLIKFRNKIQDTVFPDVDTVQITHDETFSDMFNPVKDTIITLSYSDYMSDTAYLLHGDETLTMMILDGGFYVALDSNVVLAPGEKYDIKYK